MIDARLGVEWYADGPTTHLTDDSDTSLCGQSTVPGHVDTHAVEGGEELYLCDRCRQLAEDRRA